MPDPRRTRRPVGGEGLAKLPSDYRIAALAAAGLVASMILPWYSKSFGVQTKNGEGADVASESASALSVFTFVEAAVLLVAIAVCALMWYRAEGRPFHLPGGDGAAIMIAGGWASLLIVWRLFDKPGDSNPSYGLEWGIFVALGLAGLLAYAGFRIREQHLLEPHEATAPVDDPTAATAVLPPDDPPTLRKS